MRSAKQNLTTDIAALKEQLSSVITMLATLVSAPSEGERGSFTSKEFQKRHKLSESQYHKLRREGRGPRTMSTGDVGVRISSEADKDWVAAREAEAAARDDNALREGANCGWRASVRPGFQSLHPPTTVNPEGPAPLQTTTTGPSSPGNNRPPKPKAPSEGAQYGRHVITD